MRWSTGTPWLAAAAAVTLLAGCGGDPIGGAPAAAGTPSAIPWTTTTPDAVPTLTKPPAAGAIASATPSATPVPDGTANGRIVEVEGASMWLEGEPRPMVHWAEETRFTELSDASRTDLAVGTCARVRPSRVVGGGGTQEPQGDLLLTAAAVTISEAVDGTCAPGPGMLPRGAGSPPGDNAAPPDGPGPRYWFEWRGPGPGPGRGFNGLVTAIDGDNFTIEIRRPWREVGPSGSHQDPVTHRVTTNSGTTWQRTADVDATAVQVGKCAMAMGRPAGPGHFYAESITLRPAKDGQCPPERRGSGLGRGPDGPQRPWMHRAPEHGRPEFRPERPHRDEQHRDDQRERERDRPEPEPVSGGSGAGGGAAGMQLR